MATLIADMRASLLREINVPGFPQLPTITNAQVDGYIADGFWEARLLGLLSGYTQTDGTELATPLGAIIFKESDLSDLPQQYQVLIVMVAGMRLLRLKALNLATSLRAHAGPVEYEQQVSATVLREILQSLERRMKELMYLHTEFTGSAFQYFDGELQRTSSMVYGLGYLTVT